MSGRARAGHPAAGWSRGRGAPGTAPRPAPAAGRPPQHVPRIRRCVSTPPVTGQTPTHVPWSWTAPMLPSVRCTMASRGPRSGAWIGSMPLMSPVARSSRGGSPGQPRRPPERCRSPPDPGSHSTTLRSSRTACGSGRPWSLQARASGERIGPAFEERAMTERRSHHRQRVPAANAGRTGRAAVQGISLGAFDLMSVYVGEFAGPLCVAEGVRPGHPGRACPERRHG